MSDITFVNGMKPKRNEGAPDWAVLKQTIYRDKFIPWLQEQPENIIHIETLIAKSTGNLYTKVDSEERAYQERVRKEGLDQAKAAVTEEESAPQPQQTPADQFEDDIPF